MQKRRMKIKQIKESENTVKKLQNAYKELDREVTNAMGDSVIGAKKAEIENKKLQLAEEERQLKLEKSRSKKKRDEGKIIELEGDIQDLQNDIDDLTNSIAENILGIQSASDAADTMVNNMIEAFRNGEDYMAKYEDSFNDMINSMIEKAVVGKLIGDKIDQIMTTLQARIDARVPSIVKKNLESATADLSDKSNLVNAYGSLPDTKKEELLSQYKSETGEDFESFIQFFKDVGGPDIMQDSTNRFYEWWAKKRYQDAQDAYNQADTINPDDVSWLKNQETTLEAGTKSSFEAIMSAFGIKYGDQKTSNLSGLQQGIQSITEEQAVALEGYMNGVSGQVYLHSTYLQQIAANSNVSLGTQSQMLLNLQNSYTVLMGLQQLLSGWSSQNERSVRVEIIK